MKFFGVVKSIILWSYERGSWQYDLLCIVILAFIFLTPNYIFDRRLNADPAHGAMQTERTYVNANELATGKPTTNIRDLLADVVSRRFQRDIIVRRVEVDADPDGTIRGYRVWLN